MGAETFFVEASGKTAEMAFSKAVEEARYDFGHRGYTGTIAEKGDFVMIQCEGDAHEYADQLIEDCDSRIDDKWGPAGCVRTSDGNYLFFGWASC